MTIRIRTLSSLFVFVILLVASSLAVNPATMRLDYYHTGNATQEMWSFDRVVIEPLPWPGDMSKTIDDTNLGNYFFEVHDAGQRKAAVLARLWFAVQRVGARPTKPRTLNRTFSESLRFPGPTRR